MCKALKFPRSTYYKALVHVPLNRELEYRKFSEEVKQCFHENKKRYGAIKIHRKLTDKGIPSSVKRVQRHMQKQELHSVVVKKYNHKANHGKVPDDKENVLNRDFQADTINQKWRSGLQTLPTSMYLRKGGHIWPLSWICTTAKS